MNKLEIKGLDCANCAAKLERALQKIEGIDEVTVDFMGQKIVYESSMDVHEVVHKMQEVADRVEEGVVISCGHHHEHQEDCRCTHTHEHHHDHEHCDCEYEHHEHKVSNGTKKVAIHGLDCANCAAKLERALQGLDGIDEIVVDFMGQKIVYASHLPEKVVIEQMQKVADSVEHGVTITSLKPHDHQDEDADRWMLVRIFVAAILLVLSFVLESYALPIALVGYVVIGYDIILRSLKNIRKGQWMDENFLMTLATFGAFYVREFHEAVGVMLFYQIGEYFQDIAVKRSRKSISSLLDLRPDTANVKRGEQILSVRPEELKLHDIFVVYPSEKVPVDGKIIEGNSSLDTSMLTGESLPQEVGVNDHVLSGSINLQSVLMMEVEKEYAESTAAKILDLVENSSNKKSPSEQFITKFARYYTPMVVGIAVAIALIMPFAFPNTTFSDSIYRACIFLVVSCPCALVISIPLSFFGGIGSASRQGILFKGGNYLEALTKMDTMVFDKTGTITTGKFVVTDIVTNHCSKEELLKMCAHLEGFSLHPIAKSIVEAYGGEIDEHLLENMQEISGHGLMGEYQGKELVAGNEKLMKRCNISYEPVQALGTIVYVAYDHQFKGYMVIQDEMKKESKDVVAKLHQKGMHTVMLSGDAQTIVDAISRQVGIQKSYARLLPQDKVEKVEELLQQGHHVAFVGDGMNDAPVLARADIGIAMGTRGSDAAIEVADVIIMNDSLDCILKAQKVAQKTMQIVKQNIIFALGIKVLVMILAAMGIVNMWLAVFADVGVALLAILNAMRALRV